MRFRKPQREARFTSFTPLMPGERELSAGEHRLPVEITGANPDAEPDLNYLRGEFPAAKAFMENNEFKAWLTENQ